jgi:atypical dual specificity phosphatase
MRDSEDIMLVLKNFGVAFGNRVVLTSVSFQVTRPGCTVLLGPSGTGKSTLLRTLAGYNRGNPTLRTWGEASYQGKDCPGENHPVLVMQNSKHLISNVLENLVCDLPHRSTLTQRMQLDIVEKVLQETGQTHLQSSLLQKVIERSLSDQRVIAILRQVMSGADLLLIDEPTAGLTDEEAKPLLSLIECLAQRYAVLVVLHNLLEARRLASDVVLLANGTVEEVQPSPGFFDHPRSQCTKLFLATGSCPELAREATAAADETMLAVPVVGAIERPKSAGSTPDVPCGPAGFMWLVPGRLAGTPIPGLLGNARTDLEALRAVGITRLVSLTEMPFNASLAAEFGIACLASPMPDMHPPSLPQAETLCREINRFLQCGEVVAVHCRAGLGRTGTVLAAYWLWCARGSLSAVQALEYVRRIEPLWVQSATQVSFLEEFALVVANGSMAIGASNDPGYVPSVTAPV